MALVAEREALEPAVRERWDTVDGLRTFSRVTGAGADVVLVHGAGVSSSYWIPAQRALAAAGPFRVHALDLPGFGRSDDPPWTAELPRLSQHLQHWLDAAVGGACALVGQSEGCEVAVMAATERPEGVSKLVLAAPAGLPSIRSVAVQLLSAAVDGFLEPLSLYPVILPDYLRCGVPRFTRLLLEQKRYPMADLLRQLRAPALVLRGRKDMVVSDQRVEAVARLIPNARTATLPGAHGAHFQHPEAYARVAASFLTT